MLNAKCKIHNLLLLFCILYFALCISSCSIPNLESPECSDARNAIRELYSFHFGNDMNTSMENIELRSKFLTSSFKKLLIRRHRAGEGSKVADEFTKTVSDFPKAFRVGKCTLNESKNKTTVEVVLFWKDDQRNDQRALQVEAQMEDAKWFVSDVKLLPE